METTKRHFARDLIQLLFSQPNVPVTIEDLAGATDLNTKQIANCLSNVVRTQPNLGIQRCGNGIYMYQPHANGTTPPAPQPAKPAVPLPASPQPATVSSRAPRTAKVMRSLKDGRLLIEAGGELWVATRLEVS